MVAASTTYGCRWVDEGWLESCLSQPPRLTRREGGAIDLAPLRCPSKYSQSEYSHGEYGHVAYRHSEALSTARRCGARLTHPRLQPPSPTVAAPPPPTVAASVTHGCRCAHGKACPHKVDRMRLVSGAAWSTLVAHFGVAKEGGGTHGAGGEGELGPLDYLG